jgi:peptidoglycan hydrolase-like protein with peptidoglycan-binding domain
VGWSVAARPIYIGGMSRPLRLALLLLLAPPLAGCTFLSEKTTYLTNTVSEQFRVVSGFVTSPFRRSAPVVPPASEAEVIEAKQLLRALHYDVGPDSGELDARTRTAIQSFQAVTANGSVVLTPSGEVTVRDEPLPKPSGDVTPELLAELDKSVSAVQSLTTAFSKISLVALGYDADCATRELDVRTVAAIRTFETQEGLPVDGVISPRLYESLQRKKRTLSHTASIQQCTVLPPS